MAFTKKDIDAARAARAMKEAVQKDQEIKLEPEPEDSHEETRPILTDADRARIYEEEKAQCEEEPRQNSDSLQFTETDRARIVTMSFVFTIWGIVCFLFGLLVLGNAKSAVHEIEAGIAFLMATLSLGFAAVITAIREGQHIA
jgi:hypothetical protein